MKWIIASIFAVLLVADAAYADINKTTGNQLYTSCTVDNNPLEQGYCLGYLSGFATGARIALVGAGLRVGGEQVSASLINEAADRMSYFCMPDGVTATQLRDVVVSYLQRNAATRHQSADLLVLYAYSETFFCQD